MKLIGELKDRVERAKSLQEAKEIIKIAGMELTDNEMEKVVGGFNVAKPSKAYYEDRIM